MMRNNKSYFKLLSTIGGIFLTSEMGVALDLMRLEGICKMLLETLDPDELENKFLSVTGQGKVENIKNALLKLTKADLRKIIDQSPAITDSVIKKYYDEYRYGRKPGFVLFWASGFVGKTIDESQLQYDFRSILSEKSYKDDAKFKDLKLIGVTKWEEVGSTVFEIGLSYLKKYSFVAPNNSFDFIHELTDCFAWISAEKGFVALYNMSPAIKAIIKQAILQLYGVKLLGLSLNRAVLDTIFNPDDRKKLSLTHYGPDSERPQKATFSDPDLASKQDALLAGYNGYDISSSLYSEGIDEETTAILGINSNRGKLYINKNLTTTQFRQWSVRRIQTIIDYFSDVFSETGIDKIDYVQFFTGGSWGRLAPYARDLLRVIAKGILFCKQKGIESCPISLSPSSFALAFPRRVNNSFLMNCESCNKPYIPSCPTCSKSVFTLTKDKAILCQTCGEKLSLVLCECGHTNHLSSADECVSVTLKEDFLASIIEELKSISPELTFSEHEYITLYCGYMRILNSAGFKRLIPSDISTFHDLYSFTPTSDMIGEAKKILIKLKEKCNHNPTNEMCESCRYKSIKSTSDLECLQQVFCFFDDFMPKPHQGHEYGDISICVELNGQRCNLQGIMKSQTGKVTRSSAVGREILDQVAKSLLDVRTEIIAIVVPATIDAQLAETLLALAKRFNKKLLFLDADFMYRLIICYARSKNTDGAEPSV